jgi:hypothetical protein
MGGPVHDWPGIPVLYHGHCCSAIYNIATQHHDFVIKSWKVFAAEASQPPAALSGEARRGLELMHSRTALILAMTRIQLPFTLLPIYSVMRSFPPSQLRAA